MKKAVGLAAAAVAYSEANSAEFVGIEMSTALRAVAAGEDEDGMEEEEEEEDEEESVGTQGPWIFNVVMR
jgi:hypothetical protein